MQLENPAQKRRLADIIASLPNSDRANVVRRLARVDPAILTPGLGAPISGPSWPQTMHDSLKLPSGATIGATDNETLRRELIRLGVLGAASGEGRNIIVERYAMLLQQIHDDAGAAAVAAWLAERK